MATITPVKQTLYDPGHASLYLWETLTQADTAAGLRAPHFSDKTIQVVGNFGTSGDIFIEGSLDGTTWKQLTDPQGNLLTFTAAGLEAVQENVVLIRPKVNAGTGVDVDVYLLVR